MSKTIGVILLAIYLIVVGLLAITNVRFEFQHVITGCLAIGAAVCLLLGK